MYVFTALFLPLLVHAVCARASCETVLKPQTNSVSIGPPWHSICPGSCNPSRTRIRRRPLQIRLKGSISGPPAWGGGYPTILAVSHYSSFHSRAYRCLDIRFGHRLCLCLEAHQAISSRTNGCGVLRNSEKCLPSYPSAFLPHNDCNGYIVVHMPVWSLSDCQSVGGLVDQLLVP